MGKRTKRFQHADVEEKDYSLDENFVNMATENMSFWLFKFIVEVQKENSEFYSLQSICSGLQR